MVNLKFDFIEQFIAQKQGRQVEHATLVQRATSALEEVHALKAEYEKILRESLVVRKDSTKELDAITERIEKAQTTYERRDAECQMYSRVVPEKITADDVLVKFNDEFLPAYKEERYNPVLQRLLAAKQEYIDAEMEYKQVIADFENERQRTRGELSDSFYYRLKDIGFQRTIEREHYTITTSDLFYRSSG
jgi:hypothetical protein